MTDLALKTVAEQAALIRSRKVSCTELLQLYLRRLDKLNPQINAIVVERREQATKRAHELDRLLADGTYLGPLHGIPMTIKDSLDWVGTPSTWGDPKLGENFPCTDATVVQRLRTAGATIFGKSNVPLRLGDYQSYNEIYGRTNNPWNLERTPGGSSGGSAAAVASGLTSLDLGSDIGGSIRNPAHACGVFGHKPTFGLIPSRGHALPGFIATTDINVVGPLARSAEDLSIAVQTLAGFDDLQARGYQLRLPRLTKPSTEINVAVWRNDRVAPVSESVSMRVDKVANALQRLGARIDFEARPAFDPQLANVTYLSLLQAATAAYRPAEEFEELLKSSSKYDAEGEDFEAITNRTQTVRFREWMSFNEARTKLRWAWHNFFSQYDVLVMPIAATPPFLHDHSSLDHRVIEVDGVVQPYFLQVFWAGLVGASYLCSTAVPTGLTDGGLPIGVQIVGPEYGDLITIEVAKRLEADGFNYQVPPLAS